MKFLLDTTTCIAATKRDPHVVKRLQDVRPDDVAIATITIYELEVGVAKCIAPSRERQSIDAFVAAVHLLDFDRESARHAAAIRADLERRGRGIGPYDTLIAGVASHRGLTLVSNNGVEFTRVANLIWEDWAIPPGTTKVAVVDPDGMRQSPWWKKALDELHTGKLALGSPQYTVMSLLAEPAPLITTRLRSDEAMVVAAWARTLGAPSPMSFERE
jgi:tRNA(fMet)-specific endonuclease VapC